MGTITSAAFFDLDHTLIRSNSGKALVIYARRRKIISRTDLLKGMWLTALYHTGIKDTVDVIASFASWLKGMTEYAMMDISSELFRNILISDLRPEIVDLIKKHKQNSVRTIILSSALYPICKVISDYLEMENPICSELEIKEGIYTGYPAKAFCFGEEKVIRLKYYCEENNINPDDSWYYGDSYSDIPVMKNTGHPVCINPDKKLQQKAFEQGWDILFCTSPSRFNKVGII